MLDPNSWRLTLVSCGVSPAAAPCPATLAPAGDPRTSRARSVAPFLRSLPRLRSFLPTRPPPTSPRSAAEAPWPCTLAPHRGPAPWSCTLTLNLGPRAARRAALGVRCGDDRLRPCRRPGGPVARGVRGGRHVRGEERAGVAESRQRGRRRDPLSFAPRVSIYLWIIHSLTDSSGRLYGRRVPLCVFRVFSVWRAVPGQRRRKTRLCLSLWARARSNIAANCTRTVTPEGSIERLAVL